MPQTYNSNLVIGEVIHHWAVKEYEQHKRRMFWYIIMFVVGLALVAYAIFTGNFLFAIIIVLFAIILFLQSHQEPSTIPIAITELGLLVSSRFYSYSELQDFFIIYNPPEVKTLFIETKSVAKPRMRIPLGVMDPNGVRDTLLEFLNEDLEKDEEPFSDMFARTWQMH